MLKKFFMGALCAFTLTTTFTTQAADNRGDTQQVDQPSDVDSVQLESVSPRLETTLLDDADFRDLVAQLQGTRFEHLLDLGDQFAFIASVHALDEAAFAGLADLVNPEDDEAVGKTKSCKSRIGCWFLINFRCKGQFDGWGDGVHKGPIRGSCEV